MTQNHAQTSDVQKCERPQHLHPSYNPSTRYWDPLDKTLNLSGKPLDKLKVIVCIPFQLRQSIRVSKYVEAGIRHEIHPLQQINGHWLIGFLACNGPGAHNTSKPSMRAVSAARGNTCHSLKTDMAKTWQNHLQTKITACFKQESRPVSVQRDRERERECCFVVLQSPPDATLTWWNPAEPWCVENPEDEGCNEFHLRITSATFHGWHEKLYADTKKILLQRIVPKIPGKTIIMSNSGRSQIGVFWVHP